MSILAAQHIRNLCTYGWMRPGRVTEARVDGAGKQHAEAMEFKLVKLIEPFVERGEFEGKTFGLGPCTYDFRIDLIQTSDGNVRGCRLDPGETVLASTIERVNVPFNVCGTVLDKSSWARLFVSAFNTHFDPGFFGYPTLEIVNHGPDSVVLKHGMPIMQMKFEQLLEATEMPYQGKYNDQPPRPVRMKDSHGAWGVKESGR